MANRIPVSSMKALNWRSAFSWRTITTRFIQEHHTAKLDSGVTDMEKGRTDTVQKGLRRVKEAEQLLLDLEQMSRQGTPDERRVARKLLEEYFPDY
jgi:uncharacterized protein YdaT